jgi:hypothetical protein
VAASHIPTRLGSVYEVQHLKSSFDKMVKPRLQNGDYHIRTESGGLTIAGTQVQLVPPGGTVSFCLITLESTLSLVFD